MLGDPAFDRRHLSFVGFPSPRASQAALRYSRRRVEALDLLSLPEERAHNLLPNKPSRQYETRLPRFPFLVRPMAGVIMLRAHKSDSSKRTNAYTLWHAALACPQVETGASRIFRVCALALVVQASAVDAATFTVPGSSATIQGAINLASSGDTVLVSPGTYPEAINFSGKNLAVRSVGGPSVTTISAPAMTPVVMFVTGEGPSAVLDGFTLTGGKPDFVAPYFGDGGGIFIKDASPTISNNIVTGNVACRGGGIQVLFGSSLISGNTLTDNRADCSQIGLSGVFWGGGISLQGAGAAVVVDNLITDNLAGTGSAVGMFGATTSTIVGNTIVRNTSTFLDCIDGGTIWMANQSDADIVQNLIAMNEGICHGGVVFLVPFGARGPALINNTIALNGGAASSGIYAEGFDDTTRLVNNIVVGKPGTVALGCGTLYATAPPIMRNNVIWSSGGTAASNFCAGQIGLNGNVSVDPRLAAPASGDYRLLPYSPAIDAGDGTDPRIPTSDFDGAPRVQDGNGDGTAVVDIGAFEAPPPPAIVTPVPASTPGWLVALVALMVLIAAQARALRRRRAMADE